MINSLEEGVVSLIRDLNGNHVIQRCLQRLGPEDSQFVYDAACAHTMEIATHRHGCCVLQRCIDFATPVQKKLLVAEIAANALPLSQVSIQDLACDAVSFYGCYFRAKAESAFLIKAFNGRSCENYDLTDLL